jgi:hypothetical protein
LVAAVLLHHWASRQRRTTKSSHDAARATENLTLNCPAHSFLRPWIEREGMKSHPAPKEAKSVIQ